MGTFDTVTLPNIQSVSLDQTNVISVQPIYGREVGNVTRVGAEGQSLSLKGVIIESYASIETIIDLADGQTYTLNLTDQLSGLSAMTCSLVTYNFTGKAGTSDVEYTLTFQEVDNP